MKIIGYTIMGIGVSIVILCLIGITGCSQSEPPHKVRWQNAASNINYVPVSGLPTNFSGQFVFGLRDDGTVVWRTP